MILIAENFGKLMDDFWEKIKTLRHELHSHPELSGRETETKRRLMSFIRGNTALKVTDMGSWFYALYTPEKESGEQPIAFRADMDALPIPETISLPYGSKVKNAAHKCGHDGHSAAMAAVAALLGKNPKIRRKVYLIFQSSEENGKGGKPCADFISSSNIGEVYAFHNLSGFPEKSVMVRSRLTQCASKGLVIHFSGKSAHAGTPENGQNPAFALAKTALLAEKLNISEENGESLRLCTVVGIHEGNMDFGISPGEGEIALTLRTDSDEALEEMDKKLRAQAEELAGKYALKVSFREEDPFPATVNEPACAEKVRTAARDLGLSVVPMEKPWRPSEDFGWYTKARPGAMFYVGNGLSWPSPHQSDYDFNDNILQTAAAMFLKLAESKA